MFSVAKKYGTAVDSLKSWNNLSTSALIVGQKLQVSAPAAATKKPAGAAVAATTPVVKTAEPAVVASVAPVAASPAAASESTTGNHTVAKGETMYQIARQYGITVIDLLDLNQRTDTNLKPGEILVVKKK